MPIVCGFKTCRECSKSLDLIHFSPRSGAKDGYRNDCKQCVRDRVAKWRAENLERAKQTQRDHYKANCEEIKAYQKQYRKDNPLKIKMREAEKYATCNKEKRNEYSRQYRKKYPKKVLALYHAYRNKKASKFAKNFFKEIKEVYEKCPDNMEVDHIIPISNEFVSGLHVPWNLQYIPRKENKIKGNKFDGTYNNESWKLQCQ